MKIKVGARCNGMSLPVTEEYDVEDDTTEEELEEMAREHGYRATGFECWFKMIEERINEINS